MKPFNETWKLLLSMLIVGLIMYFTGYSVGVSKKVSENKSINEIKDTSDRIVVRKADSYTDWTGQNTYHGDFIVIEAFYKGNLAYQHSIKYEEATCDQINELKAEASFTLNHDRQIDSCLDSLNLKK